MEKIDQPHNTAADGREALEIYMQNPAGYACILTGECPQNPWTFARPRELTVKLDISMPVMDGLESARRAREFEHAQRLPPCKIIALTGLSGTEVQQDAFASGIDVFLTRPVTLKSVVDTLAALGVR
jgi:CheY-like chemotaxis protein